MQIRYPSSGGVSTFLTILNCTDRAFATGSASTVVHEPAIRAVVRVFDIISAFHAAQVDLCPFSASSYILPQVLVQLRLYLKDRRQNGLRRRK
jgi:hypothetical protein